MIWIVYTLFALDLAGMSLSFGIIQKHVLILGGSLYHVGLITSITAILAFFWKPIAGRLSDNKGPQKIMIWCLLASAVGNLAIGSSYTLYLLVIARIIQIFGTPNQGLLRSILTTLKTENISKMLNKIGIVTSASLIVGSLVGGFLSEFENGILYRYSLMALFNLLSIVLVKQLPVDNIIQEEKSDTSSSFKKATTEINAALRSMAMFFVSDKYGHIFVMKAVIATLFQFRQTALLYQFTIGLEFTGRQIGYIISVMFLWNIFINLVLIKVTKKLYPTDKGGKRILHACAITALAMVGHALYPASVTPSIFFLLVGGVANALIDVALMELFLERVEEKEKGVAMNSFDSVGSLSELVAPLACNACLGAMGAPVTFLAGGILAMGAMGICFRNLREGGMTRMDEEE
ncbi:unnamed protein product [Phaedon cochleariae]|uniref:MFS transporter n=1 Tax=Phaedon cochleariae TaxID=80249 RepID=A0A9P0DLZ6_PHACE|nr:unnamed protein product [Phaedon cochleariae]